jgi:hypothetical protein
LANRTANSVVHSTIRVSYDPETKIMTAICTSGECNMVKGDQKLTLQEGQAVDLTGLAPLPNMPEEMSTEQANQFLAMADQMCGCQVDIGDIHDVDLESFSPPDEEVPTPEEDLENSADEDGNTVDEDGDTVDENENTDETDIETPPEDNGTDNTPQDGNDAPPDEGGGDTSPDGGGGEGEDGGGGGE